MALASRVCFSFAVVSRYTNVDGAATGGARVTDTALPVSNVVVVAVVELVVVAAIVVAVATGAVVVVRTAPNYRVRTRVKRKEQN